MRIDGGDEMGSGWGQCHGSGWGCGCKLFPMSIFTETYDVTMMSSVSLTLAVKNVSSPDILFSYILPSLTGLKQ